MTDAAGPESTAKTDSRLRQLVDFGGLLAFGAAFLVMRLRGLSGDEALVHATWFLVAGSAVGVAVGLIVEKRLALMPLLVGGFALVFGLLTVLTGDGLWVKVKVTALNLSLAVALIGGIFLGKHPLKALLVTVIPINDLAWRTLTLRSGVY
ncbi:MAG: inner membrane-spanning protein YciB, partial [bacterium]